jgi:phytanoyl-CoA hydroxylase
LGTSTSKRLTLYKFPYNLPDKFQLDKKGMDMEQSRAMLDDTPRTTPLTADEILEFSTHGYLRPGRALSSAQVDRLRERLDVARRSGEEADLLEAENWPEAEGGVPLEPGKSVGFLFNLWRSDDEYRAIAFSQVLASWASQLIGTTAVRLLEDNALFKEPGKGGELRWHQDYSYWPLAQPNAITAWIALDDVDVPNGAMRMARGSHLRGEYLPAVFGTGGTYLRDKRPPSMGAIGDPVAEGMEVDVISLRAGEVSFHHSLTWHSSGPNVSDRPRRAHVIRYVADGTVWMGERRYEFNYTDAELGLNPGDRMSGAYFPLVPIGGSSA